MEDILNDSGKLIFCAIIFIAISETMVGLFFFMRAKAFMAQAVTTMATVTGSQAYGGGNGSPHYQLQITYKDGMGTEYQSKITQGAEVKEGGQVEILYDPNNPEKARANNKTQIFIMPMVMMGSIVPLGIVLVALLEMGIAKLPF